MMLKLTLSYKDALALPLIKTARARVTTTSKIRLQSLLFGSHPERHNQTMKKICSCLLMVIVFSAEAAMTPVSVTGFNRDVMIENTASGPPYLGAAQNFNAG